MKYGTVKLLTEKVHSHGNEGEATPWCLSFLPPQTTFGKVMFLHLSVILFTGGVCPSPCWDTPLPPGPKADTPPQPPGADPLFAVHAGRYGQQEAGTHPTGMHSCYLMFFSSARREFILKHSSSTSAFLLTLKKVHLKSRGSVLT